MSSNGITKDVLAAALKALLQTRDFSKISVRDITDYCKISRNTFYYHFSDKKDLVNWIFYTETLREINTFTEPSLWLDSFVNLCKYLCANQTFYFESFKHVGQETLQKYLLAFYYELLKIHIDTEYRQIGVILGEEELVFSARMEAHGVVGIIMDWINEGMDSNYMKYYEKLKKVKRLNKMLYSLCSEELQ